MNAGFANLGEGTSGQRFKPQGEPVSAHLAAGLAKSKRLPQSACSLFL